jgi:hypothetical protein
MYIYTHIPAGTSRKVIFTKTAPPEESKEFMMSALGWVELTLARIEDGITKQI